ncbi:phenylalanine--tRNA ligase subunit beta [Leptospira idonii]|uniref:Phenylalanine--tRNA ligase beta subunit n=1 Tax=Leptospira idonii TaxID=1193500 RepID=A0A4R9M288_9LEPT|nr:phenylalanine--tRNA ligase subunit beta [Leptospira idonii]TGN20863.1 phenylalanine--tRNA ligase subunit beta [Leptospira idonii]
MKLSLNWLNDFLPLHSVPLESVIEKINTSICEIDDIEEFQHHLNSVITAKITFIEKHPNAEKLQVTKCTDGKNTHQIVTGATNVNVGDIVPLALPGTKLDGKEIQASELRGVPSAGMYCSEKELGLALSSSGVMILPASTELGISIRKHLHWEDTILTIDNKSITHRPDLWSHFGFARELSSQLNLPLSFEPLKTEENFKEGNNGISVVSNDNAHAYYVTSIPGVKIAPSLPKFKSRLEKCGIRSINNVVDVSNYLLLEVGQPTHFFDQSKLVSKEFKVDFAKQKESFPLLDDSSPELTDETLLIRNGKDPVAIAGVMGGKESAVNDSTTDLVMESAVFKRENVRKSIRKTGIRSESAVRYEKGLDSHTCLPVIKRALHLLRENGVEGASAFQPQGFNHTSSKKEIIQTSLSFLVKKLGKQISFSEVKSILEKLGFTVASKDEENLEVEVPKFRHNYDVTIPEDLVEEIGRTIGYASISTLPLSLAVETPIRNPLRELERRVKAFFSANLSFHEVYNYSFSSLSDSGIEGAKENTILAIANEMPEEHSVMRASLFPGLIKQAASNQDRFDTVNLFELGRTYHKEGKKEELASEKRWMGFISLSGAKPNDLYAIDSELSELRQKISELFSVLNLKGGEWKKEGHVYLHPNASLSYVLESETIVEFGILHQRFADQFDLKKRAFVGKIDMLKLSEVWEKWGRKAHFKIPSSFPQGQLDLSILLREEEPTEKYLSLVQGLKIPEMDSSWVHTIFRGESLGEGKKSVTYRFKLMSYDKTFTQERFKELSDELVKLAKDSGFQLR